MGGANPAKILSYYTEARRLKDGKTVFPRMALFCPSASCQLSCPYCIYSKENANGLIMKKENAFHVIDELISIGVRAIDLCGLGEPLTTPYALELLQYIRERGLNFGIITNGIALFGNLAEYIKKEGTYVRTTYDSAVPEVYEKCKGVDYSVEVLKNIRAISEMDGKCEVSVKIGIGMNNGTTKSLIETLKALSVIKLNGIQIRPNRNCTDEIKDMGIMESIARLIIEYAQAGGMKNIAMDLNKSGIDHKCWLAPIHTTVMADGNMYACCYYTNREKKHLVGNILEQSAESLWMSKRHKQVMEEIDFNECNIYDCKFHRYHAIMEDFLANGSTDFI